MKQLRASVLALLRIKAFAKDKDGKVFFTEEQIAKMKQFRGEAFTEKFLEAIKNDPEGTETDPEVISGLLIEMNNHLQVSIDAQEDLRTQLNAANKIKDEQATARKIAEQKATELEATVATLSDAAEPKPKPKPGTVAKPTEGENWDPTGADTHLFGRNVPFMAIDDKHPYNKRAYAILMSRKGVMIPVNSATSMDYEALKADLGDYYRVRAQDRIQSFVSELPSLKGIFPMRSNVQDQQVLVNMFLNDFTQADGTVVGSDFDAVVKGGYQFEPEIITMYSVMFAAKFSQLKEIETNWIGYMNQEGSSTMKMGFVEYIMTESSKQICNEQEMRWINGVRKNPTKNVPGNFINASNGLRKFIKNQIASFKVKPFAVGEWTSSGMVSYVKNCTRMIPAQFRDSGRLICYMTTDAYSDYLNDYEVRYAGNTDYTGGIKVVKGYERVKIVELPNMAPSKRIIWTFDGNIFLAEDKPGEMLNFTFEQQDWNLKVWSNFKESVWAYLTGKKFDTAAAMPSDYSSQRIWCNDVDEPADFYLETDANDTSPSVLEHTSLITVANTQATAITDFDDAAVGKEIRFKIGNATNSPTIAQAGKFSLISAAFNGAVGDEIRLKKRSDGKWIEILRSSVSSTAIAFDADNATPSVAMGDTFITVANVNATAITNLLDALTTRVYRIYGGSAAHSTTIANAGNFVLTDVMTLGVGTFIDLQKSASDGKFYEIQRG